MNILFLVSTVLVFSAGALIFDFVVKRRDMRQYKKNIFPVIHGMQKAKNQSELSELANKANSTIFCWSGEQHRSVQIEARQTYTKMYKKTKAALKN